MKKILSIALSATLVMSSFIPSMGDISQAKSNSFDTQRYGDVLDLGTHLRHLQNDEDFIEEARDVIKKNADKINFDEIESKESESSDGNFTYNGGTKYFLDRDLGFKEFTLRSVGDNIEIWVANDLSYGHGEKPADVVTQEQVDKLAKVFDDTIYPTDTEFFGNPDLHDGSNSLLTEWGYFPEGYYDSEDGKIIMLVDNIKDESYYDPDYPFFVAGFYWGTLENYIDRNIITIDTNSWETRLEETYFGTVAHEFQHLIHDDNDSMEETWLNEGMSDFAEYLCFGTHAMGHVNFFLDHPENSLVEWDEHYSAPTGPETLGDYGQAYLLQLYLYDHYGQAFVRALAKDEDHGINSTNKILEEFDIGIDFDELFRRFTIAAAIDSEEPGDGIYNFESIDININYESALDFDKDGVPAWGADYKELEKANKIQNIKIDGIKFMPTPWKVVEDQLNRDNDVLWGNEGNELSNKIIIKADLSEVETATLKFDNFIDIEEEWDYGMVQVSTDNGDTWTSLANEHTRSDVVDEGYPAIENNVPGFTGYYTEWTKEVFDLNEYAGEEILISFNYMTDWGYNDAGWFIDNIEIPEIGFYNDGSTLDGFYSLDEIQENYVEYSLTFINQKSLGKGKNKSNYRVLNIDPRNITEKEAIQLKDFLSGGKNYMIVWYPAPEGQKGYVDFTYEITTKSEYNKNKKK